MERKLMIGLDFDGVISNAGLLKQIGARRMYGLDIPLADFKKDVIINKKKLMDADQYQQLQTAVYNNPEYLQFMEPVVDAVEYIRYLQRDGHDICVVTNRGSDFGGAIARDFLKREGLELRVNPIGKGSKFDATKGYDVMIDDDLPKLKNLVAGVKNLFLYSWGYNEMDDESGIARRVSSWPEFYQHVEALRRKVDG